MRVLFTLGSECQYDAYDGSIRSEWVSQQVFVQIEGYTDDEMRYAWYLAENATDLEVTTFEILSDREYDERYVETVAYVVGSGYPLSDIKALWPKTVYPEVV